MCVCVCVCVCGGVNLTLRICSGSQHLVKCSVLVVNLQLVNESSGTNKYIKITDMINKKRGLTDSISCQIPGRQTTSLKIWSKRKIPAEPWGGPSNR